MGPPPKDHGNSRADQQANDARVPGSPHIHAAQEERPSEPGPDAAGLDQHDDVTPDEKYIAEAIGNLQYTTSVFQACLIFAMTAQHF